MQKQQCLIALLLMAIESQLVRNLDFDDIVTECVNRKARKMFF